MPFPTPVIARPTMNCAVAPELPVMPGTAVIWMMTPMILDYVLVLLSDGLSTLRSLHDSSTQVDSSAASKPVAEIQNEAGTEKAADRVDRNDKAFEVGIADLRKPVRKGRSADDTRHNTLIVSEQQKISSRDGCDHHLQSPARGAPESGHLATTAVSHGGRVRKQSAVK